MSLAIILAIGKVKPTKIPRTYMKSVNEVRSGSVVKLVNNKVM